MNGFPGRMGKHHNHVENGVVFYGINPGPDEEMVGKENLKLGK